MDEYADGTENSADFSPSPKSPRLNKSTQQQEDRQQQQQQQQQSVEGKY